MSDEPFRLRRRQTLMIDEYRKILDPIITELGEMAVNSDFPESTRKWCHDACLRLWALLGMLNAQ